MKKNKYLFPLVLLMCLLLNACGVATQRDMNSIYGRLDATEKRVDDINRQIGISDSGVVPGQAEMWAQMQSMRQDLNMLRGQMDDINGPSGSGAQDMASLRDQVNRIDSALTVMASQLAVDISGYQTGSEAAVGGSTTSVQPQVNRPVTADPMPGGTDLATTLYNSGTKAFSERRYSDAVKIFSDFVENYQSHSLISNAYFWRGESYYQMQNYSNAILSYQEVIDKYPNSNKLQSSMFKQGVSMFQSNQKEAGRVRLNKLVREHPNSPEAERAKQFLSKN